MARQDHGHRVGFPAHAGMDRRCSLHCPRRMRFPRPRGDGPGYIIRLGVQLEVSPPTRGWTPDQQVSRCFQGGFPAHAGMDLFPTPCADSAWRFPRPRGDGPTLRRPIDGFTRVSPPTRGWTRIAHAVGYPRHGFPAHAGMDPPADSPASPRSWFPRPRGDGPLGPANTGTAKAVSPPTRGWTPDRHRADGAGSGFPAHAGMDLCHGCTHSAAARFPRPRGDGPVSEIAAATDKWVSPPTRGWTSYQYDVSAASGGFPAHAGMDLVSPLRGSRADRFPRPRGDGPPLFVVFDLDGTVSPPTRGWTSARVSGDTKPMGFPAHAGMDPQKGAGGNPAGRFPRPRGDGPPAS